MGVWAVGSADPDCRKDSSPKVSLRCSAFQEPSFVFRSISPANSLAMPTGRGRTTPTTRLLHQPSAAGALGKGS